MLGLCYVRFLSALCAFFVCVVCSFLVLHYVRFLSVLCAFFSLCYVRSLFVMCAICCLCYVCVRILCYERFCLCQVRLLDVSNPRKRWLARFARRGRFAPADAA